MVDGIGVCLYNSVIGFDVQCVWGVVFVDDVDIVGCVFCGLFFLSCLKRGCGSDIVGLCVVLRVFVLNVVYIVVVVVEIEVVL